MVRRCADPSLAHFNANLKARASRGDVNAMSKQGIRPNAKLYDSMIEACATSGNYQGAEEWLCKMIADCHEPDQMTLMKLTWAGRMANASLRISRLWAYGCIIKACARNQNFTCMMRWVDEVVQKEGSVAARALCERGLSELADSKLMPQSKDARIANSAAPRKQRRPHVGFHADYGTAQVTSTTNVADTSKLARWLYEPEHGANSARVAIQVPGVQDQAVVDGLCISYLSPPPGLEDFQPTPRFMKPPGLETVGAVKMPHCGGAHWKENTYLEKPCPFIAQSLETLPTEASGYTPLSSPRSEASSDASVVSMSSQGKAPSPHEEIVAGKMPWVGQRMSF